MKYIQDIIIISPSQNEGLNNMMQNERAWVKRIFKESYTTEKDVLVYLVYGC